MKLDNYDPEIFHRKLIPAVTLSDPDLALPLAETFLNSGLDVMEITFRTDAAASSIKNISTRFPEMKIGAGTLLSPDHIKQAKDAGALFGLAPGFNEKVVQAARLHDLPFIPGVITPSEIEIALNYGCEILKLFPVDKLGGTEYIQSLEGPYGNMLKIIPMGGVNFSNISHYLRLNMVIAVGGSWLTPRDLLENKQFGKIADNIHRSIDIVNQLQ